MILNRLTTTFLSGLLLLWAVTAQAQAPDFNNYQPLRSSGKLPEDVTTLSSEKYKQELEKLKKKDGETRFTRSAKEQFYLQSSFGINNLLLSGRVLYNDMLGSYVNKVMDEILKGDLTFRKKLRIYVVKTTEVNAYALNSGIILITTGLLAQLDNEAELAFILCHEMVHIKKDHSVNEYVENVKISKSKYEYRDLMDRDDKMLARSAYSKEQESEADDEGLKIYLTTKYSPKAVDGAFDVLEYSHLPFDEIPFKKSYLENKYLVFPDEYMQSDSGRKEVESVEEEEDDDSYSSHPNIHKRRKHILDKTEGKDEKDKVKFTLPKSDFYLMRKVARYELCRLYLVDMQYEKALYSTYILSKEDSQSVYLKRIAAKSLYGLARFLNEEGKDKFDDLHTKYKKVQGESQPLYFLVDKLAKDGSELTIVALRQLWDLKKLAPADKDVGIMASQMMYDLVKEYKLRSSDFQDKPRDVKQKEVASEKKESVEEDGEKKEDEEGTQSSKYKKIKKKKKKVKEAGKEYYARYAFVDFMNTEDFKDSFEAAEKRYEKNKGNDEDEMTSEERRKSRQEEARAERKAEKEGASLGISKILVYDPLYVKLDLTKNKTESVKYLASERSMIELDQKIEEICNMVHVEQVQLNKKLLQAGDVEKLNEISVLSDYFEEMSDGKDVSLVATDQDRLREISNKYGVEYVMRIAVINLKEAKDASNSCGACLLGCIWPGYVFAAMNNLFRANINTILVAEIIDLKTGETSYSYLKTVSDRDRQDVLDVNLYNLFYQIKKSE